uniref:Uncharacterized protein n=1 Tax=Arundo donax TaxID=35708 RepID=A0A0A8Z0C2_ARUDO
MLIGHVQFLLQTGSYQLGAVCRTANVAFQCNDLVCTTVSTSYYSLNSWSVKWF